MGEEAPDTRLPPRLQHHVGINGRGKHLSQVTREIGAMRLGLLKSKGMATASADRTHAPRAQQGDRPSFELVEEATMANNPLQRASHKYQTEEPANHK